MHWFRLAWWKYLLSGIQLWHNDWSGMNPLQHILCRVKDHPNGVIWYNPSGLEPDMRCRDCGDDLG